MKHPFKIGQTVLIHSTVIASHGYPDALPSILKIMATRNAGATGKILAVSPDYPQADVYPDVLIQLEGKTVWLDICFLEIITEDKPKTFTVNLASTEPATEVKKVTPLESLTPQCRLILKHLNNGNTITQRSALLDYNIASLPRRVSDLKENGYDVIAEMQNNTLTGQRFARYSLSH